MYIFTHARTCAYMYTVHDYIHAIHTYIIIHIIFYIGLCMHAYERTCTVAHVYMRACTHTQLHTSAGASAHGLGQRFPNFLGCGPFCYEIFFADALLAWPTQK